MIFCARVQRQDRHYCNEHWIKKLLFVEKLVNIVRKAEDERKINMKYIINAKIVSSHIIYERRQYSILSLSLSLFICAIIVQWEGGATQLKYLYTYVHDWMLGIYNEKIRCFLSSEQPIWIVGFIWFVTVCFWEWKQISDMIPHASPLR